MELKRRRLQILDPTFKIIERKLLIRHRNDSKLKLKLNNPAYRNLRADIRAKKYWKRKLSFK